MSSTVGSNTTSYVWDVAAGLPVILQDGTNTYVYGLGLISTYDGDALTYRLTDGLGSTVNLCDASGNVLVTYAYDAFGGIRSQSSFSANYHLFTGEQRDAESGFDYLRARYYDPEVGRFLSEDLLGNGYPYGANNPANMVDPFGLLATFVCQSYGETPDGIPVCLDGYAYDPDVVSTDPLTIGWPESTPSDYVVEAAIEAAGGSWSPPPAAPPDEPASEYHEVSVTACVVFCINVGAQFTDLNDIHPVVGTGVGGGFSAVWETYPDQTINEGLFCGGQGSAPLSPVGGGSVEGGYGGILSGHGSEYGGGGLYVGTPGVAVMCGSVYMALW
jgi:RHS repeat-associated protein